MLNLVLFFGRVVLLLASREARLGVASRTASLLLRFWGGWVVVTWCLFLRMRCVAASVAGGSFRASRLGLRRCF